MEALWFWIVAGMLAAYVVLDGFDLGVGAVYMMAAKTDDERRMVLQSIGPVWDGNEVWLLAAGGTLYFAFPVLYASAFSGFYLPLMMVLWLLIGRGLALELRAHVHVPLWKHFWDAVFSLASALLAVFFGIALGNVIRGVPINAEGYFFLPLWTDFRPQGDTGILDWFTVPVGVAALCALAMHGALWIAHKTEGELQMRAKRIALRLVWIVLALTIIACGLGYLVRPATVRGGWLIGVAILCLATIAWRGLSDHVRFLTSCAYILAMLAGAAVGLFPYVLPSISDSQFGLTIHNAAAAAYGLSIGLRWFIPGIILCVGYFFYVYRHFAGKVK